VRLKYGFVEFERYIEYLGGVNALAEKRREEIGIWEHAGIRRGEKEIIQVTKTLLDIRFITSDLRAWIQTCDHLSQILGMLNDRVHVT